MLCRTLGIAHPSLLHDWPAEWWYDWLEQYCRKPWTEFPDITPDQAWEQLQRQKKELGNADG